MERDVLVFQFDSDQGTLIWISISFDNLFGFQLL